MALPPVNIPNVNYGSYARPQQVQVDTRGQLAIGQAIAQGFQAAASFVNAKAERKRKNEEAEKATIDVGQKKGDIESAKLSSNAKTANLIQNTNVLRDISSDITDFEIQKSKDPSLNFTLEKQQLFGIVDNINYLENNVLDPLPTDLTEADFVNRASFETYDQLRKLKTNQTPLEYAKDARDISLYIGGKKQNLRDVIDNIDTFDYTKGLKYKIENNQELNKLGKSFIKIAENYVKIDGNRKVLDYDRAASVIGDFPEIKDVIKSFGENIYNGYLKDNEEDYDPSNQDHVSEVATLLIDRVLSNVPKDFGDAPAMAVKTEKPLFDANNVLRDLSSTFSNLESSILGGTGQQGGYDPITGIFTYNIVDEDGNEVSEKVDFVKEPTRAKLAFGEIFDQVYSKNYPSSQRPYARGAFIDAAVEKINADTENINSQISEDANKRNIFGSSPLNKEELESINKFGENYAETLEYKMSQIQSNKPDTLISKEDKRKLNTGRDKNIFRALEQMNLEPTYLNFDKIKKALGNEENISSRSIVDMFLGKSEKDIITKSDADLASVNI